MFFDFVLGTPTTGMMKNHFNKELIETRIDIEGFENGTKGWICHNLYIDDDVKVRGHCHNTGKYRGSTNWYCNIKVKLSRKIPVLFENLKKYNSRLVIQELGQFSFKINAIPNDSEKFISFNINNKLPFIDSFQFLIFSFHIPKFVSIWF